jgi:nitrate reductase NapE component
MSTLGILTLVWAVISIAFITLLLYRQKLTSQESDWIPLTDDAREERAIQAQTMIEMKTKKLTIPIRALGTLSVVILLAIFGVWLYQSIYGPPHVQ